MNASSSFIFLYSPIRECRGFLVDWIFGSSFISFILRMVLGLICLSVFLRIEIALFRWSIENIPTFVDLV